MGLLIRYFLLLYLGLPPKTIEFKTSKYDEAVALANKWINEGKPDNADDYNNYMANQKMIFMQ